MRRPPMPAGAAVVELLIVPILCAALFMAVRVLASEVLSGITAWLWILGALVQAARVTERSVSARWFRARPIPHYFLKAIGLIGVFIGLFILQSLIIWAFAPRG